MLLSRADILAIYDTLGKEALDLLTHPQPPVEASSSANHSSEEGGHEAPGSLHTGKKGSGGSKRTRTSTGLQGTTRRGTDRKSEHRASYDSLTGLYNRSQFQERCEEVLNEARRVGAKIALFLLGLDHFKHLNNLLGFKTGDAVLVEIAQALQSLMSNRDLVSRFGDDEFALMMGLSSENDMHVIASRLLEAAAASMRKHTSSFSIGASLGVALFPDHSTDVSELIQNAGIALSRAKSEGRGRVEFFKPKLREALIQRLQQLSMFQSAVEAGEVRPFYQPQIRLSDRRSYGFEALARWVLPNGDILYPGQFQAVLDDPDAAILLGEHMLQSVCIDMERWRDTNMPACKVSVNVSAPELKRGDYPSKIAGLFSSRGLPLSQLTIEITESVLLGDRASQIAKTLSDLRKLGVSISLDDFGTGFASLTHLKSFAIDQIKIDRSFVANLPTSANDWAIVRATMNLAKALKIETVAEGLESEKQLKCLLALGCDCGQGFFLSPAIPASDAEAYHRANRALKKAQIYQFELPSINRTA